MKQYATASPSRNVSIDYMNSITSWNRTQAYATFMDVKFLSFTDDGTNFIFSAGEEANVMSPFYTISRTDWLSNPGKIAIYFAQ